MRCERGALERVVTPRDRGADDPGEHVTAARRGEGRGARADHAHSAVAVGDQRRRTLQQYDATGGARERANGLEVIGRKRLAGEAHEFTFVGREDPALLVSGPRGDQRSVESVGVEDDRYGHVDETLTKP